MTDLQTRSDEKITARALELAAEGVGRVSPGPLVGCVIVAPNGEIAGEGTYLFDGVTHAEAIALKAAGDRAAGGTAYVSLEPHSHHGRTRPCTDALIEAGIVRVVSPIEDPNPLVSGRGFAKLRESGVEVVTGIMEREATRLNEQFICWHTKKRPFVHLKLAASLDGRISLASSVSTALSSENALRRVHELRHRYDAILVGSNTAVTDDPALTDRSGSPRRRPLCRVVLDDRLRLDPGSRLAATARETPTILFTKNADEPKAAELKAAGVEIVASELGSRDLAAVLDELRRRDIQSVLVEGGAEVAGAFCDAGLVDKVTFFFAPLLIGGHEAPEAIGGKGAAKLADALRLVDVTSRDLGGDIEISGYPS